MEDHSVKAYLERQSTEKLVRFLLECQKKNCLASYSYVLPDILAVLKRRNEEDAIILAGLDAFIT